MRSIVFSTMLALLPPDRPGRRQATLERPLQWIKAAAAIVVMVGAAFASADEVERWKDDQGREHVRILGDPSDVSPPDVSPAAVSPDLAGASSERLSVEASLRRRKIVRALRTAAGDLESARRSIERVAAERHEIPGEARFSRDPVVRARQKDARENAILSARLFEEEKRRRLFALRRDESARLEALAALWKDFAALREELRAASGEALPPWWRERIDCRTCPPPDQVEADLALNREIFAGAPDPALAGPEGAAVSGKDDLFFPTE